MLQTIQRSDGSWYTADRTIVPILNGLTISEPAASEPLLTLHEAINQLRNGWYVGSDSMRFLTDYGTILDIVNDGSVITWQEVAYNESESTGHLFFQSLHSCEVRRVGETSYQISRSEIPHNDPNLRRNVAEQDRKAADYAKMRFVKLEQEVARKENSRVMAARRAAGQCELCGVRIWPWSFGVTRGADFLRHNRCADMSGLIGR